MFLLLRSIYRGSLRSAGISRLSATTIAVHRLPSLATRLSDLLFLHWRPYSGYYSVGLPKSYLIVACLVNYLSLSISMLS